MTTPPRRPRTEIPAPLKARLDKAREALLTVHKGLLDEERVRYERARGRIDSSYHLLQLVINDPWFAWLHPLSELVVQIDVLMEGREPPEPGAGEALLAEAARLLRPDQNGEGFPREYFRVLQESPAVVVTHAEAVKLLSPAP
jgi:hypothetical protein